MMLMALAFSVNADAQGWLGKLKDRAVDAAKRTVESNVDRKTSKAVDDAMNPNSKISKTKPRKRGLINVKEPFSLHFETLGNSFCCNE